MHLLLKKKFLISIIFSHSFHYICKDGIDVVERQLSSLVVESAFIISPQLGLRE